MIQCVFSFARAGWKGGVPVDRKQLKPPKAKKKLVRQKVYAVPRNQLKLPFMEDDRGPL